MTIGDPLGQTLGNRYHFDQLLGEGTFARVYRVTDSHRRAVLAAKVLRRDIAQDLTFLERFQREADVLARLQHPNIVRYYDIIEHQDILFILMDYIPGQTLSSILRNQTEPFTPHASLTYLAPLASALHFAHNEDVIHRDLKPANILIHENQTLYITDFGIARIVDAAGELTMGGILGTPLYMAPEQITGNPITVATDIYALGIILYRMYTGQPPFRGEHPDTTGSSTAARIIYEHVHTPPKLLVDLNPDLSLAAQDVVLRCLEKEPSHRYPSMSALYDALAEAIGAPPASLSATKKTPGAHPEMKLPEWSQFMTPLSEEDVAVEEQETIPPPPDRIEHPAPQIKTQPNLGRAQVSTPLTEAQPTLPALNHVAHKPTPPPAHIAPPAYTAALPPEYDPARRNWTAIIFSTGALLIFIAVCIASIYLLKFSDSAEPDPTNTPHTPPVAASNNTLPPIAPPTIDSKGTRIAFDSERDGNLNLYLINVDGSGLQQLTNGPGAERGPAWSPDGAHIAFYGSDTKNGNYDIYIIKSDGTALRNLTNSPTINDKYPTWSPDGSQLAFHSNADGDYDIYAMSLNGSGLHAITNNNANDLGPDWSPEGSRIAFHSDQWGSSYEVALLDLATREVRRLTNSDDISSFPTWSPDGTQIAYHTISSLNRAVNIYILRTDNNTSWPLTNSQEQNAFPDWSPDGTHIIYQHGASGASAIYTIPISSGTPRPLTGTQTNFLPEWEP